MCVRTSYGRKHCRGMDSSVQGSNVYGCKACIGRRILDVYHLFMNYSDVFESDGLVQCGC